MGTYKRQLFQREFTIRMGVIEPSEDPLADPNSLADPNTFKLADPNTFRSWETCMHTFVPLANIIFLMDRPTFSLRPFSPDVSRAVACRT